MSLPVPDQTAWDRLVKSISRFGCPTCKGKGYGSCCNGTGKGYDWLVRTLGGQNQ